MNDTQVNNRQTKLLEFLLVNSPSSRSKIENLLKDNNVSRITIIRDLNYLISVGLIEQVGGGKYVEYRLKPEKELLIPIDLEKYFSTVTDVAVIAYLQPFTDGNKRTSRMISNAILLSNGYYPLSYRSVDEVEYKKALILFYEQNNLYHLKRIFLEQQGFGIENYFLWL